MTDAAAQRISGDAYGPRFWLARRPLLWYFVLTYAFTWLLWIPYFLSGAELGLLPITLPNLLILLGQYGPMIIALVMSLAIGGSPAARRLLRRHLQWRVGVGWYLLAIFGPFLALGVVAAGWIEAGPMGQLVANLPTIIAAYLIYVLFAKLFLGGGLGEEAGWRGFALPRLQERHGATRASLILGLLWAGWHAPLYLSATRVAENPPLPFAAMVLALAFVLTWVYNRTQGSLLIAALLHSAFNSAPLFIRELVPNLTSGDAFALISAGYVVVALLIIAATRGQLGFRHVEATRTVAEIGLLAEDSEGSQPGRRAA